MLNHPQPWAKLLEPRRVHYRKMLDWLELPAHERIGLLRDNLGAQKRLGALITGYKDDDGTSIERDDSTYHQKFKELTSARNKYARIFPILICRSILSF